MTKEREVDGKLKVSVEQLVSAQHTHVETVHADILKKAAKLGEQDGAMNLPQLEDTQTSPNEGLLKYEYQKLIAESWKRGKPYLDYPHIEYHDMVQKLKDFDKKRDAFINTEKNHIQLQKTEKEANIQREFASKKLEIDNHDKMLKRDYVEAKQHLQEVQERVGRKSPIIHMKSTFLYTLLLIGIGFSEVPLNIQIFQKFGEAFYITIIMACSLAIAIPVLAHFSGVFIKQRKEKREYTTLAIVSVMLFIIFNFGVSIFRTFVLAQTTGEAVSNLNIVIFTCLNLILFIIGLLAAYFRHDESYELEYMYKKSQKEKRLYDTQKGGIQEQLKNVETERNVQLKVIHEESLAQTINLHNRKDKMLGQRNEYMRMYDELLNSFVALEAFIDASYRIAIEKYRATNLINRSNHLSPKSWKRGIRSLDMKFQSCTELDPN